MKDMDDDLLERFSHIVRRRRADLAALARAEGASPEDAVDCVQEALSTLLGMLRQGKTAEDEETLGNLLAGIVRNTARNRRRRHFRSRPHEDIDAVPIAATGAPVDLVIARAEEHLRLRRCVDELCEIQKAVVTLRMLEEKPGEDVARALGISAGHVAVLLHRAKSSLRACMADERRSVDPAVGPSDA
jgi:RNA polymerase sigma factor (sigma-70 family)